MDSPDMSKLNVGQLLIGGFQGTTVTPQAYHLIVEHRVSTMFLSRKNAVNVEQMTKLIKDLQYIAYSQGHKYPILFAMDEEGGMMNSLFDPDFLTQYPGAMALAATGDPQLVYEVSKAVAIELKKIGFSIILGPVLDVVTKLSHQLVGVRSFGTTVEDVVKYGMMCAKGLQDGGLFTVGKHFPGIGNATVDSLLELPMIGDSLDQVKNFNSVPFAKLIEQGVLDGVSAAGCAVPNISPDETHACLSPMIINQLLRNELKFDGFVVSECLEMETLYHSIGLGQGVVLAISAGCDLVMVCHDLALQNEAVESMRKAVHNGDLDEEIILASIARIEKLQKKSPTWSDLFPRGEASAKEDKISLFKYEYPELWQHHQKLSSMAYQKSITLVRDFNGTLPISKFLAPLNENESGEQQVDSILLLTPLLNPIYQVNPEHDHDKEKDDDSSTRSPSPGNKHGQPRLFTGEEVFQKFGDLLANHPINKSKSYNVLHTTYTANGLTPLHESLIESSKIVIVLTSEASRNMYQIGIVKYVSILCGANPASFSKGGQATYSQLTKPLIIVATSSPYDFFYSRSIGSVYMCCYDYTNNALEKLVGAIMGDFDPEGCIPGEKKFLIRKRRLTDELNSPPSSIKAPPGKVTLPKRRWLVDELDLKRDWTSLVKLWKTNTGEVSGYNENKNKIDYQAERFYKRLYGLLATTAKQQKHFVVRNSSLNILYGVVLTWADETPVSNDLTGDGHELPKTGHILFILVDKSKRLQSVGKNLHARAIRYLIKEQGCTSIKLGGSFPLIMAHDNSNLNNSRVRAFMNGVGWNLSSEGQRSRKKKIMIIRNLENWVVPKKIFHELMIVGVRFDICNDSEKLMTLIESSINDNLDDEDACLNKSNLYLEAIKHIRNQSPLGVKIIIALEPTHQKVIGSIIFFTNKSQFSKFYPFIDECVDTSNEKDIPLTGGIIGPVIDPSYSNLADIFKYGLICSAITFLKSSMNEDSQIDQCVMVDVLDDKTISGVKEIGFDEWKSYYDYYDKRTNPEKVFLT
ncbi:glycosyl hyrolase, family 3-like protein [Spathaspora passalidarum NRRL Y-27907]|uniref:Glycosyl hyrolase, family 3-like protein n=1 Tax=Spathaspora passalidarum (strain NRRL Y-27907 / 11-Y1) TaxID=619300 RepID=G3AJD5_SPAPN|nr:glycosyl hyrolase, family 3-like protein [Spathaspora passalidarum NRRL Y-27907]EGW34594.1 glycosyl hyrolase, family 3-like protein [Spathaspora passalidarum NRRL Y-27907]